MIDSINFDFGKAQIFKDFVVFEMFEGVHITPEHNQILEEIVEQYFKGRPFVYITHRKHSYSVDPSIYFKTSKIENLAGFAVVAGVPVAKANAEVEKLFLSMSGNPAIDQPRSMYLVELALDMSRQVLKPGGNFLAKVFQGEGFDELLKETRSSFTKVQSRKPDASRGRSREVYQLATGFKG